jgi:hypothetical protein
LDISKLSLQDLLADVPSTTRPGGRPPTPVEEWIKVADIHPGTTRVSATDLYREFHMWWKTESAHRDTPPPGIRLWGKNMAGRFKTGRGNRGIFYYISRDRVVEIPPSLAKVGPGNPGG